MLKTILQKSRHGLFVCLALTFWVTAAEREDLRQNPEFQGRNLFAKNDQVARALGLGPQEELELLRSHADLNGVTHLRFRQLYRGVPVWGEHVVVSIDNKGQINRVHGRLVRGIAADVARIQPSFDNQEALASMKAEQQSRSGLDKGWIYENEKSELVIYVDEKDRANLAFAVSFFADSEEGAPTRPTYLIDAHSGKILFQFDGLTTADGTGPGGNLKIGQYHYGTDFDPFEVQTSGSTCLMNNANVRTVNLNHKSSGNTTYSYACFENTYKSINGGYCPLNDAHFFGAVVYDMYSSWLGVAPLTFQLTLKVHYRRRHENAYWTGTAMLFGDGASTFHPLVSLDVIGHEVSHGFTEQNSDLTYSGQPGGINEAFSDMAGEASEYFMRGSNDFEVGADIIKASGQALRYMYNPPLDGISIDSADDYYSGLNVHYSSGVFNKAFYLLATTSGWTTETAFLTFAKANQDYWTPSSNFVSAAQGVVDAAADLSYNTSDVVAAFAAVDITVTP